MYRKKQNRFFKTIIAVVASVSMAVTSFVPIENAITVTAYADQTVPLKVTFDREGAKSILSMINNLRTSSTDAWYWNEDNSTKTVCNGLSQLMWDEGLEQAAMQRAAEIALSYSHTRPDGSSCFTVINDYYGGRGENIAAGYSSPASVNRGWREDDELFSRQGHRRNMLDDSYRYVGIGHVQANGSDYWVEEFGTSQATGVSYGLSDGTQTVNLNGNVNSWSISLDGDVPEVAVGKTVTIPTPKCLAQGESYWGFNDGVEVDATISATVSDPSVAELNGLSLTGKKEGSVIVTYSCEYAEKTITVNVKNTGDENNNETTEPIRMANVRGVSLNRSGKNKVKISWNGVSDAEYYKVVIKAGSKTYKKTVYGRSTTISLKGKKKVNVKIKAYGDSDHTLSSSWAKKSKRV